MVTTPQIFLTMICGINRHGSRFDLTTKIFNPSTADLHAFLSHTFIYGRVPSGSVAFSSCMRTNLVFGKVSGITTMETRGGNSVTQATNDVACRNGGCSAGRNSNGKDDHAPDTGLAYPCLRPARGRSVDGTRWILRGSIILDRFGCEHGRTGGTHC